MSFFRYNFSSKNESSYTRRLKTATIDGQKYSRHKQLVKVRRINICEWKMNEKNINPQNHDSTKAETKHVESLDHSVKDLGKDLPF